MFKRRSSYTITGSGIPRFFTLWFALCASLALATTAAGIYVTYTVITDPAIIGRYAGEIVAAYHQTAPQTPEIAQ